MKLSKRGIISIISILVLISGFCSISAINTYQAKEKAQIKYEKKIEILENKNEALSDELNQIK